jgi:hypothetical protein
MSEDKKRYGLYDNPGSGKNLERECSEFAAVYQEGIPDLRFCAVGASLPIQPATSRGRKGML